MTLTEDNAGSYAYGLSQCLNKWKTKEDSKNFSGKFNNERLRKNNIDNIFNYTSSDDFVNEVINVFKAKYPKLLKLHEATIRNLAKDYAINKMKISKRTTASVVSEEARYFNY